MFFADVLRSKLTALLRPWLEEELELDLKLGFLRSSARGKDLSFDPAVLNPSIEESTRLEFKRVKVGEVELRVSPWSKPAFILAVRGVDVTLARREQENDRRVIPRNLVARETEEVLASFDPMGSSLHEIIKKVVVRASSGNVVTSSLVNYILRCCSIQLCDIHMQFQLAENHSCLFEVGDFSLEPQLLNRSSLFKGLVDSLLLSRMKSNLAINCTCLDFRLKEDGHLDSVLSLVGLSACVGLNNLQPLHYGINIQKLNFNFSPMVILVSMLVKDVISSKGFGGSRSGKELWKIARKILTLTSRLCLHKVVTIVVLWSRYVHAYESLLLLVGYSSDKTMKESVNKLSSDKGLVNRAKHQLLFVHELEESLPTEAVARARRIARYRVLSYSCSTDLKPSHSSSTAASKIISPILFLWKFILLMFRSFVHLCLMSNVWSVHQGINRPLLFLTFHPNDINSQLHFSLNLEEFHVTLSPAIDGHPIIGKVRHEAKLKLPSFYLMLKCLSLISTIDDTTRSFFVSCGDLKLRLSSSLKVTKMGGDLVGKRNRSSDGLQFEPNYEPKLILWSEPALLYHPSERDAVDFASDIDKTSTFVFENNIGNLWSNWKTVSKQCKDLKLQHVEHPFILCELKIFIMDPYPSREDNGLLKCNFTLGKLTFDLDYSSMLSAMFFFTHMQHYHHWTTRIRRTCNPCSNTFEDVPGNMKDKMKLYNDKIKVKMLSIVPDKNILIGALIAGPSIRITLQRKPEFGATEEDFNFIYSQGSNNDIAAQRSDKFCFAFDLQNTEFVVWPACKSVLADVTGEPSFKEIAAEYLWLKEPQMMQVPETHSEDRFVCQKRVSLNYFLRFNGLSGFVDDLQLNHQCHNAVLKPLVVKVSTCRYYIDSLYQMQNVLSISFHLVSTGTSVVIPMDKLWTLFHVFERMLSIALPVYADFDFHGISEDFSRELVSAIARDNANIIVNSKAISETLISTNMQLLVDATVQSELVDIILNNSQYDREIKSSMQSYTYLNSTPSSSMSSTLKGLTIPDMLDMPSFGIGFFTKKSGIRILCEENHMDVIIDLSRIQSVILNSQSAKGICTEIFGVKDLLNQTFDNLCQVCVSKCKIKFYVGPEVNDLSSMSGSSAINSIISSGAADTYSVRELPSTGEGTTSHSCGSGLKLKKNQSSSCSPTSEYSFLAEIGYGEIVFVEHCVKDFVSQAHLPNKIKASIFISEEFGTVNYNIQGGLIFLETSALATFVESFKVYFLLITNCVSLAFNAIAELYSKDGNSISSPETSTQRVNEFDREYARSSSSIISYSGLQEELKRNFPKTVIVDLSQFSLVIAVTDGSDGAQELILEADASLKLLNYKRKLLFDLRSLTVFIQHLQKSSLDQTRVFLMTHSPSNNGVALSSNVNSPGFIGESSAQPKNSPSYEDFSYILRHANASIMVEKVSSRIPLRFVQLKSDLVGYGSVSGFDLTISLSDIQILTALYAPLTGIFGVKSSHCLKQSTFSLNQGLTDNSYHPIRDGAIVAIQDLHQHMYFAVEAVDNKYRVVGVLHYSLVGERALFRVKYNRRWRSNVTWISFISLYAKNDEGIALRLNYNPGSGFVEISSTDDKGWALWETFPYKPDIYEDDDAKSYDISARKAFHLVNQKNNSSIAFVDGLPEFVKKPGHPLKVKVFNESPLTNDTGELNVPISGDMYYRNFGELSHVEGEMSEPDHNLVHVNITIDKLTLTILHEVSDANDKCPLFRGCINDIHITGQMLESKFRIISSFKVVTYYLDTLRNLWMEIISPVESFFFYRSRLSHVDSVNVTQGVPVHFYFRMSQVDISLTEVSLDVLLYLVGKLNIAGPYAVRSSIIFPNCCKIENNTGLSLLSHFPDNQDVKVAGKKSASIFLRHLPLVGQHQESERFSSIQLTEQGVFSTSPINISLSNYHVFAWRTRVVSFHDSRSFPGPIIVVDISKKTEEGLSLIVSPLLRIHNESGFSMNLRFQRPHERESESVSILLRHDDTLDDSMAVFDALDKSGGSRRALMSLTLGNFLLSLRPEISEFVNKSGESISVNWSEDLKGEKAVRVSGILDKLNYKVRRAFGVESLKSFFSSLHCPIITEGGQCSDVYFLIHTIGRDVPVMQPPNVADTSGTKTSPVAMQIQKEIFIYPTVQVYNLLRSEICVLLSDTYPSIYASYDCNNIGKEATISCGSSAYLYANPVMIYFTVTLTEHFSKCKPVNSGDWVKRLHKQKTEVHYLDIQLDFGGKYFATLRLSRVNRGILEVTIFTTYTLQNNTDLMLFCSASNHKSLPWTELVNSSSNLPPEFGCILPPNSIKSWFLKSTKLHLKWLEEKAPEALFDLDVLSGFTELCLETRDVLGIGRITKLGLSIKPCMHETCVPSQVICIAPRYFISNESMEAIAVRQCYLEEENLDEVIFVAGKEKAVLRLRSNTYRRQKTSLFDSILERHKNVNDASQFYFQFQPKDIGYSWSGPISVASLGRFFLKFKGPSITLSNQSNPTARQAEKLTQFAAVHIVEESSSLVLKFYMPPNVALPYRIENCLRGLSVVYYQKESMESDILGSGNSADYVWDDFNLPHKLVVQIEDMHLLREIHVDKICTWKPFISLRQNKGLVLHLSLDKRFGVERRTDKPHMREVANVGYEVYADGPTRVLRICELTDSHKEEKLFMPSANFQFRISYFRMHILDNSRQNGEENMLSIDSTIVVAMLENICWDLLITEQYKHSCLRIQSMNVDEKWQEAPFASMIRRSQLHDFGSDYNLLRIVFVLHSTNSNVKQVKYSSIILQPIDLKVDEETLMRLVPFWRTSLSIRGTQESTRFYFKHFEIHPIKIIATFLPGNPYSSYSSAQEAVRSLLHSFIKIPAINNTILELNGVLVTHALLTFRELLIKCAQHYSWYVIRAVYIAKGSPLLPPVFASIFDDTASSSLDVFFDPSDGTISFPGLTLGMFKFISKSINSKGFSGTNRYFGNLGKTIKAASSNALFAAVTEISDSVLRGAETSGFNGMVNGFHQGILSLAMNPALLGVAVLKGGPDRKITLDRTAGIDELYIEGYLQAMLDVMYKQEYLRVRVIDNQVVLKNLPPNSSVINDIVENVKSFLVSKGLLRGDMATTLRPFHHLRSEAEWKIGPTVLTLCEHLFVSFAIRVLRKQAGNLTERIGWKGKAETGESPKEKPNKKWAISKFLLSGMVAYLDGRLCRHIPNPIARRIVSGFLLSFLDNKDDSK